MTGKRRRELVVSINSFDDEKHVWVKILNITKCDVNTRD